jgi:glycosyltransferase involved in cell wall biosynthesis
MKIVHQIDFFHPESGYEINLLARLQAKEGHDVTIVTGEMRNAPRYQVGFWETADIEDRDARLFRETGVRVVRIPTFAYVSSRAIYHPRIFREMRILKPDVLFIHCNDSLAGIIFTWLSPFLNYPLVLDSHSLEMSSRNSLRGGFRIFYKLLVAPLITWRKIPFIRLVDSDFVEKYLGIPLDHTTLLSFGADTDLFKADAARKLALRAEHQLPEKAFVVVYAGKLDDQKGGQFLAEIVRKKFTPQTDKEVVFFIVGNAEGDYGHSVEAALSQSENRVIRLPTQRYIDLPAIYQGSDIAIFPRQCSLSFFDVQACELPVLFEDNEINRERASIASAVTFRPDDVQDARSQLIELVDMPAEPYEKMKASARQYVLDHYDFVPIARRFTDVLVAAAKGYKQRYGCGAP